LHKYERKVGQEEKKREFVPEQVLLLSLTGKLRPKTEEKCLFLDYLCTYLVKKE